MVRGMRRLNRLDHARGLGDAPLATTDLDSAVPGRVSRGAAGEHGLRNNDYGEVGLSAAFGVASVVVALVDTRLVATFHAVDLALDPTNPNPIARASEFPLGAFYGVLGSVAFLPAALARVTLVHRRLAASAHLVSVITDFLGTNRGFWAREVP